MRIPVSCVINDAADAQHANQACAELMTLLSASYPDHGFANATSNDTPALVIFVRNANEAALGVHIEWTTLTGQKITGHPMSVLAMDTKLNASRRQSLYRRLLAETPMPTLD